MGDDTIKRIKYNAQSKKAAAEGKDIEPYETWAPKQDASSNEAPKKEGPGEKYWDADTMKRHKEYQKEREKSGGRVIDLDTWAKINKGTYMP